MYRGGSAAAAAVSASAGAQEGPASEASESMQSMTNVSGTSSCPASVRAKQGKSSMHVQPRQAVTCHRAHALRQIRA